MSASRIFRCRDTDTDQRGWAQTVPGKAHMVIVAWDSTSLSPQGWPASVIEEIRPQQPCAWCHVPKEGDRRSHGVCAFHYAELLEEAEEIRALARKGRRRVREVV